MTGCVLTSRKQMAHYAGFISHFYSLGNNVEPFDEKLHNVSAKLLQHFTHMNTHFM